MNKYGKMLDEEIESRFNTIVLLPEGSEEKARATEDLERLYKLKLEEEEKSKGRFFNLLNTAANVLGTIGGLGASIFFMRKGFKFEETGTYTSQTFKTLFDKLKIKK